MKPLYKQKYPHLFSPMPVGRKGQVVYKNRILVPPVCSMGYGTDAHHRISEDGIRFYTPWAQGGFAGLTVPVEIPLNGGHRGTMSLRDDLDGFAYMHNLQRPVHMYGVVTLCEIYHAGCCILPDSGYPIISASSFIYNGHQVKEMDDKDMEDVLKLYVDTAVLAVRAGFDGICLHYGHGWLINNFLSPLSNHRTDSYGGSVENRTRFPKMILKAIREAIGYHPIIELRMNGSDKMEGGITPEDAVQQALIFEEYVDMVHVSCGTRLDATSRPIRSRNAQSICWLRKLPTFKMCPGSTSPWVRMRCFISSMLPTPLKPDTRPLKQARRSCRVSPGLFPMEL